MMPALRLAGSLVGTLCFTFMFCLIAPLMSGNQGASLPKLISPVQLVPRAAASQERQKQIRILPKKILRLSKSPQRKNPKREKIDPVQIQMNPLEMEETPTMAATMPLAVAAPEPVKTNVKTAPGGTIYDMVEVDSPPRLKHYSPPMYPPRAKGQGVEGRVFIRCAVSAGGKVLNARIIQADPVGYFEKTALKSVKKWTFIPAKFQGKKVAVHVDIPLSFSLD
ncbi:MAG: energy transducer TonB [Desulfobacteraceae bacterium]|nr:energy transducer TonB [Desulfobacteraceae bacterium]